MSATCFATSPAPIGIVSASGHFTLDRSEVWGNTTLFDGGTVETTSASSEAALRNGVRIHRLASGATVNENHLTLIKGVGQVTGPEMPKSTRPVCRSARLQAAAACACIGSPMVAWNSPPQRRGASDDEPHWIAAGFYSHGPPHEFLDAGRCGRGHTHRMPVVERRRYLIQDQDTQEVVEVRATIWRPMSAIACGLPVLPVHFVRPSPSLRAS